MFHNGIELLRTESASSSSSSSSTTSSSSSSIDEFVSSSTNKTPSEITIDDIDQLCDDKNHIKEVEIQQFAQRVLEFSSQYGSDYSISYTACNITGRPSKFPNYGDFPETFAMRTYGQWWDMAPSRTTEIMPQTIPKNLSQDFIVIQFEEYVFPSRIGIFETYNPGAIVKLFAYTITDKWVCLWKNDGAPKTQSDQCMFTVTLKNFKVPIKILRIEFNHKHLEYFTEIDGVLLTGLKYNFDRTNATLTDKEQFYRLHPNKGPIQRRLESVQFKPVAHENRDVLKDFLIKDLENFIAEINSGSCLTNEIVPDEKDHAQFTLKNLPSEILLKICSYLDLQSLFRISETCRKLHHVARDSSLYSEVNLKPYWHLVDSSVLRSLSARCRCPKKIDLSWCGLFTNLHATDFQEFIKQCGSQITHLRLNSVKFFNVDCLETVSIVCEHLKELSLRNASLRDITGNALTRFRNLERLDLFHADIAEEQIMILLKNNRELKHINLAFGQVNMDDVSLTISQYNKKIVSIDMWKSHGLSAIGLLALATCTQLEEVDFGWCLREEASPGESLKELLKGCSKLKKLFLAAIRGLTDRDLENIANLCPNLEQLDLLGVMGISTEKCYTILCKCTKLKFIDLSFCVHLDSNQIAHWKETFNVSIKRSFVRSDIDYRAYLNRNPN